MWAGFPGEQHMKIGRTRWKNTWKTSSAWNDLVYRVGRSATNINS
jgi:hypothetical protein